VKLFLVDDESFALRLLTHQLSRLGFSDVTAFDDPAAALAALEANGSAADMVLLDLQMPGIDGIEFIRHLARLHFGGGLVLVSGENERILQTARRLAEAHRLHVRGALHKPVTPAALEAILGDLTAAPHTTPAFAPVTEPAPYSAERIASGIDAGEFVNVYQPKVRLSDGEIVGVETLVRWQHPDDGLVSPLRFIGTAEECGLIDRLTRTILSNALQQGRLWRLEGRQLHLAVNISMDSLSALDFPDFVAETARTAGIPPHLLVLEVTESRLMRNPLAVLDVLTRIRLKHIGLSIDDFGTGHSSLAQLRDIPFDELKIDRRFVHQAHADTASRTILEASLGIARQLGMRTVAEGVELAPDWALLRELGCDVAQGYFVARPMSPDAFGRWAAEWEARRLPLRPSVA
jgi:EAL domain-containing protein (putative c-di-GMP-specific phosphodiesterase class I)/ActR/RegA family two-component response regulator